MDIKIRYKDEAFKCDATASFKDVSQSPFSEWFKEILATFNEGLGCVVRVTVDMNGAKEEQEKT